MSLKCILLGHDVTDWSTTSKFKTHSHCQNCGKYVRDTHEYWFIGKEAIARRGMQKYIWGILYIPRIALEITIWELLNIKICPYWNGEGSICDMKSLTPDRCGYGDAINQCHHYKPPEVKKNV